MKILDLFCGGGGAGMGYHQSGFEVVGVDLEPQPHYPFEFVRADAMEVLNGDVLDLSQFDAVHASPPCQGYSGSVVSDGKWTHHSQGTSTPRLIAPVRGALNGLQVPYVIENVVGARNHMLSPSLLCGSMFGRPTPRHRLFEVNFPMLWPWHPTCRGRAKAYALANGIDYRDMSVTGKSRRTGSIDVWRDIMQMPWAGRGRDLSEAIYPAYTNFIVGQLGAQVERMRTAA